MIWLKWSDVEIPIPYSSTMKNPKPIDDRDYKPYDGPICENP